MIQLFCNGRAWFGQGWPWILMRWTDKHHVWDSWQFRQDQSLLLLTPFLGHQLNFSQFVVWNWTHLKWSSDFSQLCVFCCNLVFSHQRLVTARSVFSCYKYDLSSSFQQNSWKKGYFTASHHVYTKVTKGLLSRVRSAVVCQNNLSQSPESQRTHSTFSTTSQEKTTTTTWGGLGNTRTSQWGWR